jgi:uncharacterized protein
MAVQVSFPGVYIDEFAPGAPIEGVGTSTAAFIGPAARGEMDRPTKLTSWDQFRALYGDQPLPGFFLWYAVRGFFENGGKVCYVVRASNGAFAQTTLVDRTDEEHEIIRVRARQPGAPATAVSVEVADPAHALASDNVALFRPTAEYRVTAARELEIQGGTAAADAARFRPGDVLNLGDHNEQVPLVRVAGARLRLGADYVGAVDTTGTVRLADLPAGARTVRLQLTTVIPDALVPGVMLTITQGTESTTQIADTVETELVSSELTTYRVTFRQPLGISIGLDPDDLPAPDMVQSEEFTLSVTQGIAATEYPNLALDAAHRRYYVRQINDRPGLITVEPVEPPPATAPPGNLPDAATSELDDGADEDLAGLTGQDYIDALETLRDIDDVNLIAVPDATLLDDDERAAVQQAVIAHCEQLGDRFAILDAAPGLELFGNEDSIEQQRRTLDSTRGYGALYYPWLRVRPAGRGAPILAPPSGHVCGVIARSDGYRGVHKAPANEIVNGALDVERTMSDVDQGQLNMQGINVIRVFQSGGRPMLWGARTTATDRNWQYVNIRRLFLFLEESIQEGIRWAVFEPNIQELWEKLKRSISAFLTQQWRDGALFGATAKEAFYVRIDETLNPVSSRALGRLYIEIGVQPPYPAEFIIVRIGIWQGGAEVTEG